MAQQFISFPKDFLWGAATSSFQIEGSPLADGAVSSDWYRFTKTPGRIANGQDADIACDHYYRYKEDVALMKDLGLKTYRFSVSWPRVIPARGQINAKGLDFYRRLVDELHKAGIVPNATLFHWEVPDWAEGNWENRETAFAFREYAEVLFKNLGKDVPFWSTFNEPICVSELGRLMGVFPPGVHDDKKAYGRVAHHLNLAHGLAVAAYRQMNLPGEIGWVHALHYMVPATNEKKDVEHAKWMQDMQHAVYLGPTTGKGYPKAFFDYAGKPEGFKEDDLKLIHQPIDFLGVNNYFPTYCRYTPGFDPLNNDRTPPAGSPLNDLDWPIVPQSLYDLLVYIWKDYGYKKMLITENGFATRDSLRSLEQTIHDDARVHYIGSHLEAVHRAMQAGAPIKGYYAWSLLDNFEWAYGYDPRFGIVHVDYATQKRTLKDSAKWYKQTIAQGGFDMGDLPQNPSYRYKT